MKLSFVCLLAASLSTVYSQEQVPQQVTFSVSTSVNAVNENVGFVQISISGSGDFSGTPFEVGYLTQAIGNSPATPNVDYTSVFGFLTFTNGNAQTVNVPISTDSVDEPDETFAFIIFNPDADSRQIESPNQVDITILGTLSTTTQPPATTQPATTQSPTTAAPGPCVSSPCDMNADCAPLGSGGFTCTCRSGFVGNGFDCVAMGGGDDPHFSIVLPTGDLLCFTVQGEHDFAFNLISTDRVQINALFVQDSEREEVTWMEALGIIVQGEKYLNTNKTSLRFDAGAKKVFVGDKMALNADTVDSLQFKNGKLVISEKDPEDEKDSKHPSVCVNLEDVGLHFHVTFYGDHLDIYWNSVTIDNEGNKHIHGLIGQFFRKGVEIDKVRKLLILPEMPPVPVMRREVWAFMEREVKDDQLCWTAMNYGYQGEGLIEGKYLDYLVDDVLNDEFVFKKN